MKRGLILIFTLLLLYTAYAQEDELRINVDSKLLGKESIIVNLTEFLGRNIDYYLVNKPKYVDVKIDADFKLLRITPRQGKAGSEVIIITTNKSKEFSINDTVPLSKRDYDINNLLRRDFNFSYDSFINEALLKSIENLKLKRDEIDYTEVNFSNNTLYINIDNRSIVGLGFSQNNRELILRNASIYFESEKEDDEFLFYQKKGFNFFYFIKNSFPIILIFILSFILIILITLILTKKRKNEISKEDFKKAVINKLALLKRSCHEDNLDNVFAEFSNEIRSFLAKILNIKYQFTYDELINELIIKNIDENVKKDLIKFARIMLEINYKTKPKVKDIKEIMEKFISIIERI